MGFEVRVFVEDGIIGVDVVVGVVFFFIDGGDIVGREVGGVGVNKFGEVVDEFEFVVVVGDVEMVVEEVKGFLEVFEGVFGFVLVVIEEK